MFSWVTPLEDNFTELIEISLKWRLKHGYYEIYRILLHEMDIAVSKYFIISDVIGSIMID